MEQQRTIWTVLTVMVVIILVVISVMAYQTTAYEVEKEPGETEVIKIKPYFGLKADLNLPPLDEGYYYLWVVLSDNNPRVVSQISHSTGSKVEQKIKTTFSLREATSFMVTRETGAEVPIEPSNKVIMAMSDKSGSRFLLKFPYDYSNLSGVYRLSTPSNGLGTSEKSGVWFTNLTLPQPPSGWTYLGWVKNSGLYLTTGTFDDPKVKDGFSGYSGPRATPATPGEDFLTNSIESVPFPLDLTTLETEIGISLVHNTALADSGYFNSEPATPVLKATVDTGSRDNTDYPLMDVFTPPSGEIEVITK